MLGFQGAIFDLDGTLLDSMWIWEQIDIDFLGKRGLAVPEDYIEKITPMHFHQAAAYTIERFGLPETPEMLIDEWSAMALEAYRTVIGLKPHAKEYLLYLKENGVKLSVATASSDYIYTPALKRNGIYDLFDAFTSSQEVARGKGFPDVYELAAERIGLKAADCAVFEDIYAGIKGANDGGFFTVGVEEPCSAHEKDKIMAHANRYISDYQELLDRPEFVMHPNYGK